MKKEQCEWFGKKLPENSDIMPMCCHCEDVEECHRLVIPEDFEGLVGEEQ